MADPQSSAASLLTSVTERIARAAEPGKHRPAKLIAISKTVEPDRIRPFLAAGHTAFGENRIQEARRKWPSLRIEFPDIELHGVGQIQSNKARDAVDVFDVIHSVDRLSLVDALGKAMADTSRRPECFLQVNIGQEPQKGGCAIGDLPTLLEAALAAHLPVVGLMAVPPIDLEPSPYFALLAKLAKELGLSRLSMGMSGDFETAAMLGATDVRVGSALFGHRS